MLSLCFLIQYYVKSRVRKFSEMKAGTVLGILKVFEHRDF